MSSIQKSIAARCQQVGKPLFLSGGVLSNTVQTGELVCNEIADVTNALFDGVTGFMLLKAFDINYAIKAVKTLNEICCTVEPLIFKKSQFWRLSTEIKVPVNNAEAALMSAAMVANIIDARVIIMPTVSGRTAKALLWLRPSALIITVSTNPRTTRFLFTYRNIIPLMFTGQPDRHWAKTVHSRAVYALDFAISRGYLIHGDMYVTLQRSIEGITYCDMVRIFKVTTSGRHMLQCPEEYSFATKKEDNDDDEKNHKTIDRNGDTENDTKGKDEGKPKKAS
ncbi:pyruvate kinase-like [Hyposmocoma kahamanoa]|uniref:pyruvate kinase-like n=1 Tax=Hyposmocoma kahamanoa TaxID=1477025 RepID=UPI000E6D68D0|nr:pyruvate kinase-like [Hyposmocoma kahamanoa]